MKKENYVTILSIVETMASVAWIIIVLLFAKIDEPEFFLWGGFIFAIIGFVLTFAGMFYFSGKRKQIGVEIAFAPYYFLCVYYVASLLLNTIFAIRYDGEPNKFVFVGNLILYVVYGSILLYANSYVAHMTGVNEKISAKTSKHDNYRMNLSNLVTMANTKEVKDSLKKLKELVDYSGNVSVAWAENHETLFIDKLNEIYILMSKNAPDAEIIAVVQQATDIWKNRNIVVTNK